MILGELAQLLRTNPVDLLDEDGRPLGEAGSRLYDDIETKIERCPYSDSRAGEPMNASALRQISDTWKQILQTLCALRGPDRTLGRAWWACMAATLGPLIHEVRSPGVPVPRELAALYKTSVGFTQILAHLLLEGEGLADLPLSRLGSRDELLSWLERDRWLHGDVEVCAGTAAMIGAVIDQLADAEPTRASEAWLQLGETEELIAAAIAGRAVQGAQLLSGDPQLPAEFAEAGATPWLTALRAGPGRRAVHIRRLFVEGAVPAPVESYLAALG